MKRLIQALSLLQLALVIALGLRVIDVVRTEPPSFGEIPDLPALTALPPPRPRTPADDSTTDAIVKADLFEAERGVHLEDINVDSLADAPPLPPPTNVKVSGILLLGEPVAILSDPSVGPDQRSLRKGDMFGDYEVGEIGTSSVILMGSGGQQFHLDLRVEAGGGGGAAPGGAAARPAPAAAGRPVPAGNARPQPPRPGAAAEPDAAAANKSMTAKERAQAIAQRNAAIRGNHPGQAGGGGQAEGENAGPDPAQARLEALRKLREAAKTR